MIKLFKNIFSNIIFITNGYLASRKCVFGSNSRFSKYAKLISHGNKNRICIGENTLIESQLMVYTNSGEIEIGNYCFIGPSTRVWSANKIIIRNHVLISHGVHILDSATHPIDPMQRREDYESQVLKGITKVSRNTTTGIIEIKDDVWIGFNASIMGNVTIGRNAIIMPGSLVLADVAPNTIVAGCPARAISKVQ